MKRNFIIFFVFLIIFLLNFNGGINDKVEDNGLKDSISFDNFQMGIPFSSFFSNKELVDKRIFSITQDTLGKYILANRRGLISFNSKDYDFIKTPGMPYKVARDPFTDKIYVACNNSIGYLVSDKSEYYYKEITDQVGRFIGDVKLFFTKENITLYYKNYIIVVSKDDYSNVNVIKPKPGQFFGGIIQNSGVDYVLIKGHGIVKILDDRLADSISYPIEKIMEITFSIEFDDKNVFGTTNNSIYIEKKDEFIIIDSKKIEYLENKIISEVVMINNNTLAISTLNGGLVFLDIDKQKIVSVLNNFTGLPDNEVFTVYKDIDGGIVISNNYGLFRFDMSLPILNYGDYPGLEGSLLSSSFLDTTLYVLTSQGVYYLTKAQSDLEFQTIVKKTVSNNKKIQIQSNIVDQSQNIEEEIADDVSVNTEEKKEGTLKKWAGKIFGKNKRNKKNKNQDIDETNNVQDSTVVEIDIDKTPVDTIVYEEPQYVYVVEKKAKKKQFSELYFIYKKIEGIDGKCKQSIQYKNQLIVATNSGLFLIKNNKATVLLKNEYITKISKSSEKNVFYVATTTTFYELNFSSGKAKFSKILTMDDIDDYVFSIAESDNAIWLGGEGYAYKIDKNDYKKITMYPVSPDFLSVVNIQKLHNNIHFFVPQGMYKYNSGLDSVVKYDDFLNVDANSVYFINGQDDLFWSRIGNSWKYNSSINSVNKVQLQMLNLIPSITDIQFDDNDDLWIISNTNKIYKIKNNKQDKLNFKNSFKLNLKKVKVGDSLFYSNEINLKYHDNLSLKIELESPFYITNDDVYYQFSAFSNNSVRSGWSEKKKENTYEFPINVGTYQYYFRAINALGQESGIQTVTITVKPPFWKTDWFRISVILCVILLLSIFILIRQKSLKRRNLKLEQTVKLRTVEISKKNEELITQSEEISKQNTIVKKQRDEIQNTHEYVTQSINYARRIQTAIFPSDEILSNNFSEHFVFLLPRDIVSGDFFWFKEFNNKLYITVADCTGHGVPGAFLSMMGIAYLNEIITYKKDINAGQILDSMRQNVIYSLQEKVDNSIRDGMDMSFAIFDFENMTLEYAAAYNSIYLFRENKLIELKADRMPIGFSRKNATPFTNNIVKIKKDDILYLFTDGFADQFGGANQRKFLAKNFKKLFSSIVEAPMEFQNELILTAFSDWKGENTQVDDVTIIGLKI